MREIEIDAHRRIRLVDALRDAAQWRFRMIDQGLPEQLSFILFEEVCQLERISDGLESGGISVEEGLKMAMKSAHQADENMRVLESRGVI